jgi:hypothetical protein
MVEGPAAPHPAPDGGRRSLGGAGAGVRGAGDGVVAAETVWQPRRWLLGGGEDQDLRVQGGGRWLQEEARRHSVNEQGTPGIESAHW